MYYKVEENTCDECFTKKICITVKEGYGVSEETVCICYDCIQELFKSYANKQPNRED